jgi:hypothetical protein
VLCGKADVLLLALLVAIGSFLVGFLSVMSWAEAQIECPAANKIGGGARPVSLETSFYGGLLQGLRELGYVEGAISSSSGALQK